MKIFAVLAFVTFGGVMAIPLVFANGDAPAPMQTGCLSDPTAVISAGELEAILATIRARESGGDYGARAMGSTASGAYQFVDGTWASYGDYPHAWMAPPGVQDAKARESILGILATYGGDVSAVPVVWYLGHLPAAGDAEWDTVPGSANRLTPRQYQAAWLEQHAQISSEPPAGTPPCASVQAGSGPTASADGSWAFPADGSLFGSAPVDKPHHDYPAWDWGIPEGTTIYAMRGGEIASVTTWAYNSFDHPCGQGSSCSPCGMGVTIVDDAGTRWTYCHGSQLLVDVGDPVAAGTPILSSGNTGRSTGPHLHIAIRTSDGQRRCPQPLLRSLRDLGVGISPADLPTSGCSD